MLTQKQKEIIKICSFVVFFSLPAFAFARGLVPCGGDGEKVCGLSDIFVLIARVTNWLIMAAGAYAVYKIVNSGFMLVISMGNEESITKNRKALSSAVVGFVFTMMAFMFINTVVNIILRGATNDPECKIDFTDPMTYLDNNGVDKCNKSK
jgi:hypothetical protein